MSLPDAVDHLRAALGQLGLSGDPELDRTPERFAELLSEFSPQPVPPCPPLPTRSHTPVVVRELRFHSLCAHHLLPFFGHCTIAYRPAGAIAGLGWFPRALDALARRPQLQERLAQDLADAVFEALTPHSVLVWVSARQMCVEMRGSRATATFEVSAAAGAPDPELLALVRGR